MALPDLAVRERVTRIEAQLADLEGCTDSALRDSLHAALAGLLELYGEGLERILAHVARAGDAKLHEQLCADEWIAQLLLLHDLHPEGVVERAERALDSVRPALRSHGGDVELLEVKDGVARLRLRGSCDGCPSSAQTLRMSVESALRTAVPEIESIETEAAGGSERERIPRASLECPVIPPRGPQPGES